MSVRRTKVDGEAALIARVSPTLWKVVYPNGKVSFFTPEATAKDAEWDESQHPRGDRGRFTHGAGELSAEERDSVLKYAGKYYAQLNRNLRLGLPLSDVHDGVRRGLDSLLQRSTLHTDTTLFRGVGDVEKTFGVLKEGDVVENPGFVSTTNEHRAAYLFSKSTSGLMEISAPAGTHAFDVGALSEAEPEILLPRGTKMRYVGRGESPGESYRNLPRTYKFEIVRVGMLDWNPFQRRVPAGEHGGGQWAGENLTERERREVTYYTTKAYRHINSTLREGLPYVLDRTVPLLDSAIAKSVIGKDYTVFRGVNSDRFIAKLEGLQPGEEIADKAYTSASGSYLAANQYSGVGRPVMEIRIPKGSNALYAESMSVSQGMGEEEYILPRNSTFRYVEKTGRDTSTRYVFDLVRKSAKDVYDPNEPRVPAGEPGGGQWRGENLTSREKAEVGFYTGEGYFDINASLRGQKLYSSTAPAEDLKKTTDLLDSALAKSVLTSDTVVYRGVDSAEFAGQLNALTPGELITDAAYVSTSGSLASAAIFAGGGSLMEIRLPKGSNALYTEGFSMNSGAEEDEYILPRGTTFKYVTSRTTKTGKRIHTFDLAPRAATDAYDPDEPRVPKGQTGGGQWAGKNVRLTKAEKTELTFYTAEGSAIINSGLRAGESYKDLDETVALIDSAIRKSGTSVDMVVYRGIEGDFLDTLSPGEEVVDKGYLSTTDEYSAAATFGQHVLEIRVPAGSNIFNAESLSASSGFGEQEHILPRSSALRFVGKKFSSGSSDVPDGAVVYVFDLVPRAARDWNPFQPRVPKGNTGGGEWTEGGSTGTGKLSLTGNKPVGLQPVHVDALKQYTANIYYPINKALRAKPQESLSTQEQAVVKALDEAFDRSMKTTEVMQLFRAAGEEFANVVDTLKVGEDVTDHAFASTTIDENYARTLMAGQSGDKKALIEVVLPKDSRAIDTSPFNPFKGENETLLPRNTTFRYLGKERDIYRFRANPKPIAA